MKNNKAEKFSEMIEQFEGALWRVVLVYERQPDLQEELFQEVLLAVWKSLDQFKGLSSDKTYLFRVAHNTAFAHIARQSRQIKDGEQGFREECEKANPEKITENEQRNDAFARAMFRLPVSQRHLISLSMEGLSYAEVGEIVGMSANHVGVELSRAKKRLRDLLI
ncbi:RNA polymerase sigma factor [Aliikangiella sp. G2MR2-5]|uniref:RNA polymerase sigma factor n=1 Tax=Aliikangiella sp. G2MR2-5 TaxID=2788943 RepID=UPI0018AA4CB0|nr:sigma-70 family RNA polymerase sigma factor [Aliikangiella sp. G2MR2-5]